MRKWRCSVCGEIVESDVRPEKCPRCFVPGDKFVEVLEEGLNWAAEHVVGVGARHGKSGKADKTEDHDDHIFVPEAGAFSVRVFQRDHPQQQDRRQQIQHDPQR